MPRCENPNELPDGGLGRSEAVTQSPAPMLVHPPEESPALPRWEHFSHMADMGVRGIGRDCSEAFAQAAVAMVAILCDPATIRPERAVTIRCEAPDTESLLVDWLNALIYEMAVRRMLFSRFEVRVNADGLKATAWGEAIDRARHRPAVEVKGATYTALKVAPDAGGAWLAQCVVDV